MQSQRLSDNARKKIRKLLLAGATYEEIKDQTGIPPKRIYAMARRLRQAGHVIQPKVPKRQYHVANTMRIGSGMKTLLSNLPEDIYIQLLRSPGDTWTDVLFHHLTKDHDHERQRP
jgi:hypothetical protein